MCLLLGRASSPGAAGAFLQGVERSADPRRCGKDLSERGEAATPAVDRNIAKEHEEDVKEVLLLGGAESFAGSLWGRGGRAARKHQTQMG